MAMIDEANNGYGGLRETKSPEKGDGLALTTAEAPSAAAVDTVPAKEELERNFTFLSALGMAFSLLNSWTAMSASLSVVLPSGGPVAMLWGLVVSFIGSLCMAASLAEICSIYTTSGGQYDWSYALAPPSIRNGLAFFTGWMSCAGWVALTATGSSLGAQFVIGIISLLHPNFESEPYQTFVIYTAFTIGAYLLNTFAVRLLPLVDRTAFFWSLGGIVVVSIVLLATASPEYQPASFVFGEFINETGWPNGVTFLLGLLQSTYGLAGFDAVSHMVEEMPNPSVNAPKVMVAAILLGASTSWIFLLVLLFCLADIDSVTSSASGPLLQIYYQATNSRAGAVCLVMFNVLAMVFATQGLMMVASRMVRAFARDRGFGRAPSAVLARVHPTLKAPIWAILFVSVWVVIFGLTYLGSTVALNAILSASVVFVQISYIIPITLVVIRGRDILEVPGVSRTFNMGALGYAVNVFALAFAIVTSVFFIFPPEIPVASAAEMNYVIVVFAIVLVLAAGTWLVDGRKRFLGPLDRDRLTAMAQNAKVSAHAEDGFGG